MLSNNVAMQLVAGLLDGTVVNPSSINVFEAVAFQIYGLVFGTDAPLVSADGWGQLYCILASLVHCVRVPVADPARDKSLREYFDRKKSNSNPTLGLAVRFRDCMKRRECDIGMDACSVHMSDPCDRCVMHSRSWAEVV